MIFAGPTSSFTCSAAMLTSGLVGTIGVRIVDASGTSTKARVTTGITEPVTSSGFYVATINLAALAAAPTPGHYYVFWDDGSVTPGHIAAEDLYISGTASLSSALKILSQGMTGYNAENVAVGLFLP